MRRIAPGSSRSLACVVAVFSLALPCATYAGTPAAPAVPAAPTAPADDETAPALPAALRDAARDLGAEARLHLRGDDAAAAPLRAAVMAVTGRVQWRADEKHAWNTPAIDDLLVPGSRIRTGRASSMTLRVGHNATVMIGSHTRLALPMVLREGETLRTVVEVSRGRADIKVDRVGLTNDFSVVTPSGTLAVRGTGFAVDYGGFEGMRVEAARFNEIASIEVQYFLSRFALAISARAITSSRHPNPAVHQLFRSFGPPRLLSAVLESDATPELLMATMNNHVRRARRLDLARMGVDETTQDLEQIYMFDEFALQQFDDPLTLGQVADFICNALNGIFVRYAMLLNIEGLGVTGLPIAQQEIDQFCVDHMGPFDAGDLQQVVNIIVAYCVNTHAPSQHDVDRCIQDFYKAVVDQYNAPQ